MFDLREQFLAGIDYIARKIEPFAYNASYFAEREDVCLFDALT